MVLSIKSSSFTNLWLLPWLVVVLTLLSWHMDMKAPAWAEEEGTRFCQGFLYCNETKGDTTSTQAFFYLYSTEERGPYSRLSIIPFYSRELDPTRDYLRRSVLWPLGISERKSDSSYFQILPFYWHADNPIRQYTVVLPLYFDYAKGDRSYTHFIPFYGHHQHGNSYHRYFGLGPLVMATFDTQTDLKEWDVLFPLFHYKADIYGTATRLFPLYRYSHAVTDDVSQLDIMVLFQSRTGPTLTAQRLFPLYYYENDQAQNHVGWSLLGYDQFALAGYRHESTRTWHQFIPLYRTTTDHITRTHDTNILGIGPFSLYRYWDTPEGLGHRFFPLYLYDHPSTEEWHISALFPGPLSLYRHDHKGTATHDRLFPLYSWTGNDEFRSFSLLGASEFAVFRQERGPSHFTQRLFPLYGYKSFDQQKSQLSILGFPPRKHSFAWSLYEQGNSPTYFQTRLFPLYRFERNDETKEVNWSALLLYRHVKSETYLLDMLPPLYEYERNDRMGKTELTLVGLKPITLFKHGTTADARSSYLFPLYDYHRKGNASRLSLVGWPKMGAFPTLSLFEKEGAPSMSAHRLFPLYRYRRDDKAKTRDWNALLWWHRQKDSRVRDILFPLTDVERDSSTNSNRVSLVGLPRFGNLPALTLFNWEQTPSWSTHRFFPMYHYSYNEALKTTTWNALWLYWHHSDPAQTQDTFFPLGSVRRNLAKQAWNVSALGVEPVSLVQIGKSPTSMQNRFSPLWDYRGEGGHWGFSLLGVRRLSVFSHETTANSTINHLFPLWSTSEHRQIKKRTMGILGVGPFSLYYHRQSPDGVTARIFPAWSYQYEEATRESQSSVLGIPSFSLYYRRTSPTATESRLFPLFRHASDRIKDESEFWFLWPLFDHKTAQGRTTQTSLLWWMFQYRSPRADEREYWVIGHRPIAMYMRTVSPTKTLVEINPLIPLWRHEYVEGAGMSWAVFGGLIGMDAIHDGSQKLRLFWRGVN